MVVSVGTFTCMGNCCFTKHPLKNGCFGFEHSVFIGISVTSEKLLFAKKTETRFQVEPSRKQWKNICKNLIHHKMGPWQVINEVGAPTNDLING